MTRKEEVNTRQNTTVPTQRSTSANIITARTSRIREQVGKQEGERETEVGRQAGRSFIHSPFHSVIHKSASVNGA